MKKTQFVVERTLKYRYVVTTDASNERQEGEIMSPLEQEMFEERHRTAEELATEVGAAFCGAPDAPQIQLMSGINCVYPVEEVNGVRRF